MHGSQLFSNVVTNYIATDTVTLYGHLPIQMLLGQYHTLATVATSIVTVQAVCFLYPLQLST